MQLSRTVLAKLIRTHARVRICAVYANSLLTHKCDYYLCFWWYVLQLYTSMSSCLVVARIRVRNPIMTPLSCYRTSFRSGGNEWCYSFFRKICNEKYTKTLHPAAREKMQAFMCICQTLIYIIMYKSLDLLIKLIIYLILKCTCIISILDFELVLMWFWIINSHVYCMNNTSQCYPMLYAKYCTRVCIRHLLFKCFLILCTFWCSCAYIVIIFTVNYAVGLYLILYFV